MKTTVKWLALFLLPVIALAMLAPEHAHAATTSVHHIGQGVGGMMLMGLGVRNMAPTNLVSYTSDQLKARMRPQVPGVLEAIEDVLYDTITYPAAGVAALTAFSGVAPANGDLTLSNMAIPGTLPQGQFFDVHRVFIRPLAIATATATIAGRLQDVLTLLSSARGIVSFVQNDKPVGPIPIGFCGDYAPLNAAMAGLPTAANLVTQAAGFPANGGFPVNGAWKIGGDSPNFRMPFQFNSTAIVADLQLQVVLFGIRYRPLA